MPGRLSDVSVLVVEDNYLIANDLKRALRQEGANVVGPFGHLCDGIAAVDGDVVIDIAVLDVNLGDDETYPLADRLKAAGTPSLFVTGFDGWSMPDAYRDVPRLAKPFTPRLVIDTLVGLLDRGAST